MPSRDAGQRRQFAQQGAGARPGIDHPATGVEHRPLRVGQQFHRALDRRRVAVGLRPVGAVHDVGRPRVRPGLELDVLGDVDHHRARPARGGDVEGVVQHPGEVVDVLDQEVVLAAGAGDAHRVAFLEGIRADQVGRHLAGDADQRDRIQQRIGETGHHIGCAGAGGHQQHARLAGRARVAFGRMRRALLVTHQDVLDGLLLEQGVVDRQDRPSRVAEDVSYAVILQRTHHDLGPGQSGLAHAIYPCFGALLHRIHTRWNGSRGGLSNGSCATVREGLGLRAQGSGLRA
jgi:hypothetical protein